LGDKLSKKKPVRQTKSEPRTTETREKKSGTFHIEFLNAEQKNAWKKFEENDIIFCLGAAGSGKTFLSTAYACQSILTKNKKKITLTRPIIESQESLGYLPGSFSEKVAPYLMPMYDSLDDLLGKTGLQRDIINHSIEVSPIAYQRGRTHKDAICLFDEAQNATYMGLKLFLTRIGSNAKLIINGDPAQSDLRGPVALMDIVKRLEGIPGIAVIRFSDNAIVRHPLIKTMLQKL
jgi:phosphate starvation-inducible PhoH-like protein